MSADDTDLDGGKSYIDFDVPLKGGDSYRTFAVSPYYLAETEAERDGIRSAIMTTFASEGAPSLDVEIKRQRTAAFLEACGFRWVSKAQLERRGEISRQSTTMYRMRENGEWESFKRA